MGEDEPQAEGPEAELPPHEAHGVEEHTPPGSRRPNVVVLLAFLGVFLLLLVVFREVLFPFLMAMFIAYLVEPVVQWVTKSKLFGIRWTRGPTIVLIYLIVIGGGVFGAWKGLTATATYVRSSAKSITAAAEEEVPRAYVSVSELRASDLPVDVPRGSFLQGTFRKGAQFKTVHAVRIEEAAREVSVLLERATNGVRVPAADTSLSLIVDGEADIRTTWKMGLPATGLELRIEEELITPIVENFDKLGIAVTPNTVRDFLSHKTAVWSETLPDKVGSGAFKFAGKIALSIYEFFLILMLTAFIVTDRKGISRFFANLTPKEYRPEYLKLVTYIDDGLAGVIRGQLVICLVNGVLTWIGLVLLGVKGALVLSFVAAVLSLIPIFGTIVSSIPIVLIAATDGVDKGVLALLWIVFIHMVEANVFNPMIMGSHAQMHPVVIVFALLAGEHSFGVWGALLAVPTMSLIQSCFRFYLHEIEGMPRSTPKPHGEWLKKMWARIRGKTAEPEAKA
ncbi:MAG: AI-2E family transporter [Planctomycetota bacterium]|nr:AI-2E family transporter [Planctomycetota bacterium]